MADAKVAKLLAQWGEYVDEVTRLRAENERLRAVAAQVLTHYSASLDYQPPYVRMAREALEATDGS